MTAKPPLLPLFLGAETCLYIAFLYCDLTGCWAAGTALKYAAILLCLLLSLDNRSRKDGRLVSLALALTALADLFLLVLNQNYALGVALFCPVQLIYALRLRRAAARPAPLWPRLLFSGGALAALAFTGSLTVLSGLVCLYFPQLVCNAAESLALPPGLQNRLFSAGLWLFLCCDICVGLHNLLPLLPGSFPAIAAFAQIAMWAFYLPSQVLIVLSASRRFPL